MGRFSGLSMTISLMVWPSSELTANPETGDPSTNSEVPAYTLRLIETPGYFELEVFGMNNLGQIGGGLAHGDPGHENHEHTAFLFNSNTGEVTVLPEVGVVMGINDSGTVVGTLQNGDEDSPSACMIRDVLGGITTFTLPSIPGTYTSCHTRGISNTGKVTGYAMGDAGMTGFLYDPESGVGGVLIATYNRTIVSSRGL